MEGCKGKKKRRKGEKKKGRLGGKEQNYREIKERRK